MCVRVILWNNGIPPSHENNEIFPLATIGKGLEYIILREINQT